MEIALIAVSLVSLLSICLLLKMNRDNSRRHAREIEEQQARMQSEEAARREREKERELFQEERFVNLANRIFEINSRQFRESSEERLAGIVEPMRRDLSEFRKVVDRVYRDEARERYSLQGEIRNLIELNRSIGKEAADLARALRGDSKIQGDWGEMILERLLEKSGLKKGVHFEVQVTDDGAGNRILSDSGGTLRPDVVVYYPGERCIVVDSKVSLNAYVDYVNSETEEGRTEAGKRHLLSVRNHFRELASKGYQDRVGRKKMDFVMMFIPNEGAYMAAMQLEPGIWQEAYDKRVLIVSPTHLISILRMLEQLWKQDSINRNVEEIARLSGQMLNKFANFVGALDDIEKGLSSARAAYDVARSRLSDGNGNLIVTARKIMDLGAKTSKGAEISRLGDGIAGEGE